MWACWTIWQTLFGAAPGARLKPRQDISQVLINSRGWNNIGFFTLRVSGFLFFLFLFFFSCDDRSTIDCCSLDINFTAFSNVVDVVEVSLWASTRISVDVVSFFLRFFFQQLRWERRFKFTVQWVSLGFNSLRFFPFVRGFPTLILRFSLLFFFCQQVFPIEPTLPACLCFSYYIDFSLFSLLSSLFFPSEPLAAQPFGRNQLKFQQHRRIR